MNYYLSSLAGVFNQTLRAETLFIVGGFYEDCFPFINSRSVLLVLSTRKLLFFLISIQGCSRLKLLFVPIVLKNSHLFANSSNVILGSLTLVAK